MNDTLKSLFLEQLQDIYDAERQITEALPKLIEAATCNELKSALQDHLEETEEQITKVEEVFSAFRQKATPAKCEAMAGLLAEGEALVAKHKDSPTINAAIIAAAQRVEHYEIASYGCLKTWATLLGNEEAAQLLEEILDEEKGADLTLSELAEAKNEEALEGVAAGDLER